MLLMQRNAVQTYCIKSDFLKCITTQQRDKNKRRIDLHCVVLPNLKMVHVSTSWFKAPKTTNMVILWFEFSLFSKSGFLQPQG